MFAKDHIHPLTMAADKKSALGLPGVTAADPQDLLKMQTFYELWGFHKK